MRTNDSRFVFVTQWFPPEPARVVTALLDALTDRGVELEVITGIPNYPTGRVASGYRPWRTYSETRRGVGIHRVPLYPSHGASPIRRMLNFASFAVSSAGLCLSRGRGSGGFIVYGSPVTAALGPLLAGALWRRPYAVLVEDLWPDSLSGSGMVPRNALGGFVHWVARAFSNSVYRHARVLIPISEGMARELDSRGVRRGAMHVVMNWATVEFDRPLCPSGDLRSRLSVEAEDLLVLYAGNLGSTHGLDRWIEAFAGLDQEVRATLVFMGTGVARGSLEKLAAHLKCDRVHFIDRVDDETYTLYLADADALAVSLPERSGLGTAVPSKIPSALAAGKVILGSITGDPAEIIAAAGGLVASNDSPEAIRSIVSQLAAESSAERLSRSRKAHSFYRATMSREVGADRLYESLKGDLLEPCLDVSGRSIR